jgi:lactoylglutathione lyase
LDEGYNRIALTAEDIDATLATVESEVGITPEKPPYHPGDRSHLSLIAFLADPDGYRIELTDGRRFETSNGTACKFILVRPTDK